MQLIYFVKQVGQTEIIQMNINPYIDLTMNGGFGIRDPKIWVPEDYKKMILPVSFGLIVKPIRQVQLSLTAQKMVPDKTIYYQGGLIFLFKM